MNSCFISTKDWTQADGSPSKSKAPDNLPRYDVRDKESETEADARDPMKAKDMRDPMNVTAAYPMPEGAHFCGPVAVEGSAPYKEMAPGTNAFDYTQGYNSMPKFLG